MRFVGIIWPKDEEKLLAGGGVEIVGRQRTRWSLALRDAETLARKANDEGLGVYVAEVEGAELKKLTAVEPAKSGEPAWVENRFVRMRVPAAQVPAWEPYRPVVTWEADGKHATLDWPVADGAQAFSLVRELRRVKRSKRRPNGIDPRVEKLVDEIRGEKKTHRYAAAQEIRSQLRAIKPPEAVKIEREKKREAAKKDRKRLLSEARQAVVSGDLSDLETKVASIEEERDKAEGSEREMWNEVLREQRATLRKAQKLEEECPPCVGAESPQPVDGVEENLGRAQEWADALFDGLGWKDLSHSKVTVSADAGAHHVEWSSRSLAYGASITDMFRLDVRTGKQVVRARCVEEQVTTEREWRWYVDDGVLPALPPRSQWRGFSLSIGFRGTRAFGSFDELKAALCAEFSLCDAGELSKGKEEARAILQDLGPKLLEQLEANRAKPKTVGSRYRVTVKGGRAVVETTEGKPSVPAVIGTEAKLDSNHGRPREAAHNQSRVALAELVWQLMLEVSSGMFRWPSTWQRDKDYGPRTVAPRLRTLLHEWEKKASPTQSKEPAKPSPKKVTGKSGSPPVPKPAAAAPAGEVDAAPNKAHWSGLLAERNQGRADLVREYMGEWLASGAPRTDGKWIVFELDMPENESPADRRKRSREIDTAYTSGLRKRFRATFLKRPGKGDRVGILLDVPAEAAAAKHAEEPPAKGEKAPSEATKQKNSPEAVIKLRLGELQERLGVTP